MSLFCSHTKANRETWNLPASIREHDKAYRFDQGRWKEEGDCGNNTRIVLALAEVSGKSDFIVEEDS